MASRFWVGGTGNWDASTTTHWAATSNGAGGASVPGASDTVIFDGSSGGGTVTITANQSVISVTMGAFASGTLEFNSGSGIVLTCSGAFSFTGSASRVLTMNDGTLSCGSWDATSIFLATFNAGTGTINMTDSGTFAGSGLTYNTVNIMPTGSATVAITLVPTFANLILTTYSTGALEVTIAGAITVNTSLQLNGVDNLYKLLFRSSAVGTSRTINGNPIVTGQYADLQDISCGGTSWDLSTFVGGSGDCGGNSNITFTAPTTQHFTNNDGNGIWPNDSNWTSHMPLPQDDAIIDTAFGSNATVTTGGVTRLGKNVDWSGATYSGTLTWSKNGTSNIYGSLIMLSGLSISSNGAFLLNGRGSFNLTGNGCNIDCPITVDTFGGTYTLGSDLLMSSTRTLTLTSGTLVASSYGWSVGLVDSGTFTLTLGSFIYELTGTGTIWDSPSTLNTNSSTIKITNTSNSAVTFNGLSKTYNNVWISRSSSSGSITIVGNNTYNNFKDDGTVAHSILYTAGSTQSFTEFSVKGNPGALISLDSTTTATYNFIKLGNGNIQTDYLNIQHSVASPNNIWFAGNNSTNNQSVTTAGSGWIFTNHTTFRQPIRPRLFAPGNSR